MTTTPAHYVSGSLKRNTVTQAVAVRTSVADPSGAHDWSIVTPASGLRYTRWDEVQAWPDMPQPHLASLVRPP
ncbi:hypothetical protein [Mycobacterium sp. OTB74]|jgi:hypothetical protein|uniref:hypothetical protein n=1 Tax=Mycobacterium sp. OTB74 TaxID=1853452 RepID=UPI0024734419|nr:hypothetical protein [Mycobacterium sp. OTB74]